MNIITWHEPYDVHDQISDHQIMMCELHEPYNVQWPDCSAWITTPTTTRLWCSMNYHTNDQIMMYELHEPYDVQWPDCSAWIAVHLMNHTPTMNCTVIKINPAIKIIIHQLHYLRWTSHIPMTAELWCMNYTTIHEPCTNNVKIMMLWIILLHMNPMTHNDQLWCMNYSTIIIHEPYPTMPRMWWILWILSLHMNPMMHNDQLWCITNNHVPMTTRFWCDVRIALILISPKPMTAPPDLTKESSIWATLYSIDSAVWHHGNIPRNTEACTGLMKL